MRKGIPGLVLNSSRMGQAAKFVLGGGVNNVWNVWGLKESLLMDLEGISIVESGCLEPF